MMIFLTKNDIAKMSPELRAELMMLVFGTNQSPPRQVYEDSFYYDLYSPYEEESQNDMFSSLATPENAGGKTVVEISSEQLKELIANLSEKSIETLKFFSSGEPVSVNDLVGEDRPYATFNELKRSFVGPVNRRLRTVTRNKSAVLFKKESDDEAALMINVKPQTSEAIRLILLPPEELT